MKRLALPALVLALPLAAAAQDIASLKVLADLKEKSSWRVEMLEGPAVASGQAKRMKACTDNVSQQANPVPLKSGCATRLVKDTEAEAVVESQCQGQTATMTITREAPSTLLIAVAAAGVGAKVRYTRLGPCTPGQPMLAVE